MATSDFGVAWGDVVAHLPIDTTDISATSTPLSTADIEAYIVDASVNFAGLLQQAGMVPIGLSDDATAQIASAIKWYAVAESFAALGYSKKSSDDARARYEAAYSRYANNSRAVSGRGSRVRSNVDTTQTRTRRFIGTDYKF